MKKKTFEKPRKPKTLKQLEDDLERLTIDHQGDSTGLYDRMTDLETTVKDLQKAFGNLVHDILIIGERLRKLEKK